MQDNYWMHGLRMVVKGVPRGLSRSLKGIAADLVARSTAMCCMPLVLAWPPRSFWSSCSRPFELAEPLCSLSSLSVLNDAAALDGQCVARWCCWGLLCVLI